MDMKNLKEIWGMVAAAAGGIFVFLQWWWKVKRESKTQVCEPPAPEPITEPHLIRTNHSINLIYAELHKFQYSSKAGKVVLCKAHNGGKVPVVDQPMYITAMYEVTSTLAPGRYWERMPMDDQYHQMIGDLYLHKTLIVPVKEVSDGLYKQSMVSEGAKIGAFAEVYAEPKNYYFLTGIFINEVSELDEALEYYLKLAGSRLSKIFREARNQ
jgi:hypothetical protein